MSFAFALSFLASGALIAGFGVQTAFLTTGVGLALVMVSALPKLGPPGHLHRPVRPRRSATR